MTEYIYNGVKLPALPEWKSFYKHAVIYSEDHNTYWLRVFNQYVSVTDYTSKGLGYTFTIVAPYEWAKYTRGDTSWSPLDGEGNGQILVGGVKDCFIWTSVDILYNGSVVIPATNPVVAPAPSPFYQFNAGEWQRVHEFRNGEWSPTDGVVGLPDDMDKINPFAGGVSFIYFTDPHLCEGLGWEPEFHKYMAKVKQVFDASACEMVICGGDWIGNSDTKEQAIYKLTYIRNYMRKLFGGKALMVVGNHDTNYQGVEQLTQDELINLWFKSTNTGKAYYYVDTETARFIVLDTQTDWHPEWSEYFHEQFTWLESNLSEDKLNVIVPHIIWVDSDCKTRTSLVDAVRYVDGVSLILGGHIHADHVVEGQVPEVTTTHLRDGGTPTFDLCVLDDTKLTMVRVGTGENRTIQLGGT